MLFKGHAKAKVYERSPAFYEEWDEETSAYAERLSDERLAIWRRVCEIANEKMGKALRPEDVPGLKLYLERIYAGQIADTSSLKGVITTDTGFQGLKWEEDNGGYMQRTEGGWRLDSSHPFFREDIPEGVCAYKGIAEIVGLETPFLDELLEFFQGPDVLCKQYLVDGKLAGQDVKETKAPQAFGVTTLEALL